MVSEEAVRQIALKTSELYDENHEVNMIIVTSFQIQSNNDIIPHGWVYTLFWSGDEWTGASYHFTYWDNAKIWVDRENWISSDYGKFPRDLTISAIKNDLLKLVEDEYNFENFNYLDISSHGNILEQRNLSTLAIVS